MKNNVVIMLLTLLTVLSACNEDDLSHQSAIINEEKDWLEVRVDLSQKVFAIHLNASFIGTGFLIDEGRLITNAHVATTIKYCFISKVGCGDVIAKTHRMNSFRVAIYQLSISIS